MLHVCTTYKCWNVVFVTNKFTMRIYGNIYNPNEFICVINLELNGNVDNCYYGKF